MQIGAQFYTIRESCKDLASFSESLARVADIGYKTVQISGVCEYDPGWLRDELRKNGLKCVITHTPGKKLLADPVQVARDHDIFGCKYVGLGSFKFDDEAEDRCYPEMLEKYIPVARALRENGKYFMYHNHAREFNKYRGELILEKLSRDFAPDEMGFTLDTFWIQVGGGDPAWWINHLKGRVPCIHLKDYSYGRLMAVVGEGNINFDSVFAAAENAGTQYMLVEQDDCNGEDPFDCLKRSYEYLKSRGFE